MNDYVTLNCYKSFKCTNKECSDNCCIGWEIDVDKETMKFYKTLTGPLAKRLEGNIENSDTCHFILDDKGRCPFLNKDNLCDIILELGEDKIPYICKNHPRFYTWLSERTEMGIGLACEEGARLLCEENNLHIINQSSYLKTLEDALILARDTAIFIIKNKEVNFFERLLILDEFAKEIDDLLFFEEVDEIIEKAEFYKGITDFIKYENASGYGELNKSDFIKIFKELEPINRKWEEYIDRLICDTKSIKNKDIRKFLKENEKRYENISVYFIFRYFLKALDDMDLISKVKLCIASVIFILTADFTEYEKNGSLQGFANAVMYSKEVEYSDENLNYLYNRLSEI